MKQLRPWQAEALPRILDHLHDRPMVRAVMGSGKSILIAELCRLRPDDAILVTTPTVKLVDQLAETIAEWTNEPVGRYYTHAKTVERITVCCHASLAKFADQTMATELWIADEAHKTETADIKAAIDNIAPKTRVGFSATPWRADTAQAISLFSRLVYDYGPQAAVRDKVVVPLQVEHYDGEDTDLNDAALALIRRAKGPGLANAYNITDAENFAEYLSLRGVDAFAIHSQLAPAEQAARIEQLRTGAVRCLVHVDMLTEGVDLPWLRWLCARRLVGSRVRFAQEVGRVLRASPDKMHATVYDLHDLFGALSLDYEACLSGDAKERDELKLAALDLDFAIEQVRASPSEQLELINGIPVRLIAPARAYLRQITVRFQMAGLLDMRVKSTHWRKTPPSEAQLDFARKLGGVLGLPLPDEHRERLRLAWHTLPALQKGDVSDAINVLTAIQKARGWPQAVA
jgi:superfamily II DNA or RNA helicase